jgi:hypothetical protein
MKPPFFAWQDFGSPWRPVVALFFHLSGTARHLSRLWFAMARWFAMAIYVARELDALWSWLAMASWLLLIFVVFNPCFMS